MIEAVIVGVGILIGLNGAILAYVISIERRLTRLETVQEMHDRHGGGLAPGVK